MIIIALLMILSFVFYPLLHRVYLLSEYLTREFIIECRSVRTEDTNMEQIFHI